MSGNTSQSFKDKWENNQKSFFTETLREGSEIQRWILERNGFKSLSEFSNYLVDRKRILDADCGNGRVTALLRQIAPEEAEIVGIDLVGADIARQNLKDKKNIWFETKDILGDLSDLGKFDFIYCQEVLHHTSDPTGALRNLSKILTPGGEIAIYVYKKKAPVREFVDDYIRDKIAALPYEEAMKYCVQIAEFGKSLSELGLKVKVQSVELLGIEAGEYDIQSLIYHFFVKCFWNPSLSFEENVVINYDWYHPQIATRHTLEEVGNWFSAVGLEIIHRCVDFYGITVRGRKKE